MIRFARVCTIGWLSVSQLVSGGVRSVLGNSIGAASRSSVGITAAVGAGGFMAAKACARSGDNVMLRGADEFAHGAGALARGVDDLARGAVDLMRGADDVAPRVDDVARRADDVARGADDVPRDVPHLHVAATPEPEQQLMQDIGTDALLSTETAKGLSRSELNARWAEESMFRRELIAELSETRPELLESVAARQTRAVYFGEARVDPSARIREQVARRAILYDAHGNLIKPTDDAATIYRREAHRLLDDAVTEAIAKSDVQSLATPKELKAALARALQPAAKARPDPRVTYEFNVTDGKLTISHASRRGTISGEINAYSVARVAIAHAAVGAGGYAALKRWFSSD